LKLNDFDDKTSITELQRNLLSESVTVLSTHDIDSAIYQCFLYSIY